VLVITCDWDCNKGINNPNGVFSGLTVQLVVSTDQEPPTLYNILLQTLDAFEFPLTVSFVFNYMNKL
jgi:hypothetical protein